MCLLVVGGRLVEKKKVRILRPRKVCVVPEIRALCSQFPSSVCQPLFLLFAPKETSPSLIHGVI